MIEIIECLLLFRKLLIAKALFQTILFKMTSGTTHKHVRIFQNKNMKLFFGMIFEHDIYSIPVSMNVECFIKDQDQMRKMENRTLLWTWKDCFIFLFCAQRLKTIEKMLFSKKTNI